MSERAQAVTVDVRFDPTDSTPAEWDWAGLLDTDVVLAETGEPEIAEGDDGAMVQRLTLVVTYGDEDNPPSEWDWNDLSDTDVEIVDADETDGDEFDGES